MKVLIDMNLSTEWVELLNAGGHEAQHWSSLGQLDAGDDQLFERARHDRSVIPTNDLDFGIELVTRGWPDPSVIQLRSDDLRPSTLGRAVLRALDEHAQDLRRGVLITIDPRRARLRLLELGDEE
jgi:predicted nuclease of predicted toxin-antitoxin system